MNKKQWTIGIIATWIIVFGGSSLGLSLLGYSISQIIIPVFSPTAIGWLATLSAGKTAFLSLGVGLAIGATILTLVGIIAALFNHYYFKDDQTTTVLVPISGERRVKAMSFITVMRVIENIGFISQIAFDRCSYDWEQFAKTTIEDKMSKLLLLEGFKDAKVIAVTYVPKETPFGIVKHFYEEGLRVVDIKVNTQKSRCLMRSYGDLRKTMQHLNINESNKPQFQTHVYTEDDPQDSNFKPLDDINEHEDTEVLPGCGSGITTLMF